MNARFSASLLFGVCLTLISLVNQPVDAAMGYTVGRPTYTEIPEPWEIMEKAGQACGPCTGDPGGPAASFAYTPSSGRFPLEVTFTDTSTPGQGEQGEIVCWYWVFGPEEDDRFEHSQCRVYIQVFR